MVFNYIPKVSESDVTKGVSTRDDPTTEKETTFLEAQRKRKRRSSRRRRASYTPRTSESDVTKGVSTVDTKPTVTPSKPSITSQETKPTTKSRSTFTKQLTRPRETIREGALVAQQKLLRTTQSSQRLRGEKTFLTETKAVGAAAGLVVTDTALLLTSKPKEIAQPIATDIEKFVKGEQTELGTSIRKAADDPTVSTTKLAIGVATGTLQSKLLKPKPFLTSEKGKVTITKSTSFPEKTTFLETENVLKITRGKEKFTARVKGEGTIKPEIDDTFIGTQRRTISFVDEQGRPVSQAIERADFQVKKVDGEIRATGTTVAKGEAKELVVGRFESTKTSLPDESFFTRTISGSKKTKLKGDPLDVQTATRVDVKDIKPEFETVGFQKKQFEVTSKKEVEFELAPGIKASKEAEFTKSVDLTASEGVTTTTSQFQKDFLKRKELTEKKVQPVFKEGSSKLLGPIRVIDDLGELKKTPLKKPSPTKGFTPQETITVTKTKTQQPLFSTNIPSGQLVELLPSQPTKVGFGPLGTVTTKSFPRKEIPLTTTPSKGIITGPTTSDLSREFKPPVITRETEKATVTPVIRIMPSITRPKTDVKRKQGTRTQPSQKIITSPITKTDVKTDSRIKQKQLQTPSITQKQRVTQTFQQSFSSLTTPSRFSKGIVTPIKTPFKRIESSGGFFVEIREKGLFRKVKGSFSDVRSAFGGGKRIVGGKAAASFRIRESRTGRIISDLQIEDQTIRKSKKEEGVFIERRGKRIKSGGELKEITYKGVRASKRKRL